MHVHFCNNIQVLEHMLSTVEVKSIFNIASHQNGVHCSVPFRSVYVAYTVSISSQSMRVLMRENPKKAGE